MQASGHLGRNLLHWWEAAWFFEIEASAARSLDELAFTEYLDGLRDAGWHENPQVVRLGYAAERALWYGLGGALDVQIAADESTHEWAEEVLGHSIQEMLERDASLVGFFLACAEEARQLFGTL